jgi:uncharacterized membrane protein
MTANIHVVAFEDPYGAENMLENVNTWEQNGWIKVADAVVVTRGSGSEGGTMTAMPGGAGEGATMTAVPMSGGNSELEIKQTIKKRGKYTLGGGGIGFLAGMLLGGPIGGLVVGATVGAITGAMKDYGISDKFIKDVSAGLRPGTSALFVMSSDGDAEKLIPELKVHKGRLLSTTLSPDQEKELRDALEK